MSIMHDLVARLLRASDPTITVCIFAAINIRAATSNAELAFFINTNMRMVGVMA